MLWIEICEEMLVRLGRDNYIKKHLFHLICINKLPEKVNIELGLMNNLVYGIKC